MFRGLFVAALLLALTWAENLVIPSGVTVSSATRTVDLTTQLVKAHVEYVMKNGAKSEINFFVHLIPNAENQRLAFIGATQQGSDGKLKVSPVTVQGSPAGYTAYRVELLTALLAGSQTTIKVETVLAEYVTPHPAIISQAEQQYVVYNGDAHIPSAYAVAKGTTTFTLPSGGKVLGYTNVPPSKQDGDKIVYGPYENQEPGVTRAIRLHFENNAPFVVVEELERVIEISHWGNIAIEENIHLVHKGAKLKGSFSRLDYQLDRRGNKQPVVRSYRTLLPAAARDIYYRDEIGNISTSAVRTEADAIRPRFPLFGGWQTEYMVGYNVPSYQFLYSKGSNFALKIRLVDHVFDNAIVEKLRVKIILPEGSKNLKLSTPYPVKRKPDELHFTYLDTTGRPVVIFEKENLVENHVQYMTLHYNFDRTNLLREPLIAVVAFYLLFLVVIAFMRFDFSITSDEVSESRLKAQSQVEQLADLHSQRLALYDQFLDAANKMKASKDAGAASIARKRVENDLKTVSQNIQDAQVTLKGAGLDLVEKVKELQKLDKLARDSLSTYFGAVERLIKGQLQKPQFADIEKQTSVKLNEVKDKGDAIAYSL